MLLTSIVFQFTSCFEMAVLWWTCLILLSGVINCYENLCTTKPNVTASQSTTHDQQVASKVVDGDRSQNYGSCAHTKTGQQAPAWVQVDLGGTYSLSHVVIYYREQSNWKPYRFRQYYLDAKTETSQRIRCYNDSTPDSQIPKSVQTLNCKAEARYIIVETQYDAPDDRAEGPILEICEIQVYGCNVGRYGQNCWLCQDCPKCDVKDGTCLCSPHCVNSACGANGNCNGDCYPGFWGQKCYNQCQHSNCLNNICNKGYGICVSCTPGYYRDTCDSYCSTCFGQICNQTGFCTNGCVTGYAGNNCSECDVKHYGLDCTSECSTSCQSGCYRNNGHCKGTCEVDKFGNFCNKTCNKNCRLICHRDNGDCEDCVVGKYGETCQNNCGEGCDSSCAKNDGKCTCKEGWQGAFCIECNPYHHGALCEHKCSFSCLNGTCFSNNGSCVEGCIGDYTGEKCTVLARSMQTSFLTTPVAAGAGVALVMLIVIIISVILFIRLRRRKHSNSQSSSVHFNKDYAISSGKSAENKMYTNIGNVPVTIEDPEEEPQIENPEEAVYYNDLSVAKDIAVADLLNIITRQEANEMEGFQKEFKSLPYGERFACETAKTAENMPRNRFKTTFPYDHSRVILEVGNDFTSDYINANYIENMEGKREFIACQGPRENTLIDHWKMIWQEHVEYIVMLTNLIEGPKVKCHQYWPDEGKDLEINPFSVTLVEEKVYAYFVERKMTVQKKRVTGSRTVVQYHYTRWPDHGTPNPLNLVVFHRHFRHKIKPSQYPIIVHCSAGIGRTGTFIALDVLSRYGKDKGKVNVIEYVKAMRKDRMTMIQNVDQYVFLYHALYEFVRRKAQYKKKDEFLHHYVDVNRINTQKHLTNEFNELISLKPRYDANDFKSGKKFLKLNFTKSVLPVEQYLVYLTSHVPGRESYYNAVNVSSFTRAEEFISAQYPVSGAAIDLVRLLIDHESAFLISLNPLSEVKELQSWVEDKHNLVKISPYTITKGTETSLTKEIRKTTINITDKEKSSENHEIQIFECLNWSSDEALPKETSALTNLIKQFSLDRKYHQDGHVTVVSKDGATCCGVFIAVYNAIEQLQQDDEVDISTIVQQLQCRRPEMISTKEEYEFCFKAISDFLNTDNVYANS